MLRKSSATDDRLLEAAIDYFGRLGLEGTSTRAIAASAGTMMSSITYHYGSKLELYLAAARHITGRMDSLLSSVLNSPAAGNQPPEASILAIIDRFTEVMLAPESTSWARFALREQAEPTEAFDILHGGVLGLIVDRIAGLMGDSDEAKLKALAIIGQVLVFRVARATVLRATGWADIDDAAAQAIKNVVHAQTAAILSCGDMTASAGAKPEARGNRKGT